MNPEEINKNTFVGWYRYGKYEILGLFQKVGNETWWFSGPGEGMSFRADITNSKPASLEETTNLCLPVRKGEQR